VKPLPLLLLGCLAFAACGGGKRATADVRLPRPVSILVEVYDPVTNYVWQNVGVRIVEADQEWSGCTCVNPRVEWFLTDSRGEVLLDEFTLAAAQVGFVVDRNGRAVLGSRSFEDEATVVLEIDALGYTPVIVEVPLSWSVPDVFVSVPFN
jgi:hypothetical protein